MFDLYLIPKIFLIQPYYQQQNLSKYQTFILICLSADSAKKIFFLKTKTKTKFSYNLASGFGKNPKWEDMMQELNLVVGPEVGPLLKLTKNGKTVQDPGLIHEKEMFRDIVKYPEVVHGMFII